MKPRKLIVLCLMLVAGSAACAVAAWRLSRPVGIVVSPLVFDVGECEQGTTQAIVFDISNHSGSALELIGIRDTCECSKAVITRKQLPPGEDAQLSVEWRVGHQRGQRALPIPLEIRRNPTAVPETMLLFARATVRGDIEFSPDLLHFTSGTAATRRIEVHYRNNRFSVTTVTASHPAVVARWDSESAQAEIAFVPEQWAGTGSVVEVHLHTSRPSEPIVRIPVHIEAGN